MMNVTHVKGLCMPRPFPTKSLIQLELSILSILQNNNPESFWKIG